MGRWAVGDKEMWWLLLCCGLSVGERRGEGMGVGRRFGLWESLGKGCGGGCWETL